jgi:ribonuclease R
MADQRAQLKRQILSLLRNNGDKAFRPKEIARRLNIRDQARFKLFNEVIRELDEGGMVQPVKGGRYRHRRRTELTHAEGTLQVHPQGHGFVAVPGHGEYYIPPNRLDTAIDGDWVRIALAADVRDRPRDRHQEAEIVVVISRRRSETVGTFTRMGHFALVRPDDQRIHKEIYVPEAAFRGASEGDKVRVSIENPRGGSAGGVVHLPPDHFLSSSGSKTGMNQVDFSCFTCNNSLAISRSSKSGMWLPGGRLPRWIMTGAAPVPLQRMEPCSRWAAGTQPRTCSH